MERRPQAARSLNSGLSIMIISRTIRQGCRFAAPRSGCGLDECFGILKKHNQARIRDKSAPRSFIQRLRRQPQASDGDVHHGNVSSPKLVIYSYTFTQNKMRGTRLNTGFPRIWAVKDGIILSNAVKIKFYE